MAVSIRLLGQMTNGSQTLAAPPTARVVATIAFAASPSIAREVIPLPLDVSDIMIIWRLKYLLGAKTLDKLVASEVVGGMKGNKYPGFVVLTAPHLRNSGTLLLSAALGNFYAYRRDNLSSWDVSYNPVSGLGRVSVWWVTSRKEERKLLKGYITELYAPRGLGKLKETEPRENYQGELPSCF